MRSEIIFLCGMMGVGKSTVGLLLAEKMKCPFIDTDDLIVKKTGKTIPEIFQSEGEPAFRLYEETTLKSISRTNRAVVSLGGGTLMNPRNLELVKKMGTLIYISADVEILLSRLQNSIEVRPLLAGLSLAERRSKIENLVKDRLSQYQQAEFEIQSNRLNAEQIVEHICRILEEQN